MSRKKRALVNDARVSSMFRRRVIALMEMADALSGSRRTNAALASWVNEIYPAPNGLCKIERFRFWVSQIDADHDLSGKLSKRSPTPHAPARKPDLFYESREWRELRYKALLKNDGKCELCGAGKHDGIKLHVDHIKPRSLYPDLQLVEDNLQVLCEDCNLGKSNKDDTDWRK